MERSAVAGGAGRRLVGELLTEVSCMVLYVSSKPSQNFAARAWPLWLLPGASVGSRITEPPATVGDPVAVTHLWSAQLRMALAEGLLVICLLLLSSGKDQSTGVCRRVLSTQLPCLLMLLSCKRFNKCSVYALLTHARRYCTSVLSTTAPSALQIAFPVLKLRHHRSGLYCL